LKEDGQGVRAPKAIFFYDGRRLKEGGPGVLAPEAIFFYYEYRIIVSTNTF
jgi:hypothetical protein